MENNIAYNFRVINTIYSRLHELFHEVTSTYEISIQILESKNYKIELNRYNCKINDKEIEGKFAKIAHEYSTALFPVLFDVKENNLVLYNFQEIVERINRKDLELQSKHEGPGLDMIRDSFLNVTATGGYTMSNYFFSFGLMKMVLFCMQKTESNEAFEFDWNVVPLDATVTWKGEKQFNATLNCIKFQGEIVNNVELFDKIKEYSVTYKQPLEVTPEDLVFTSQINHETQFVTEKLDFESSETTITIKNTFYEYKESLFLHAITNKKIN